MMAELIGSFLILVFYLLINAILIAFFGTLIMYGNPVVAAVLITFTFCTVWFTIALILSDS